MIELFAKQILTRNKSPEQWFDIGYNMNLYRGCSHGCIYCDSRSECYHVENFDEMSVKINALELLSKELSSKRRRVTIGTGSMSDPYNSHEVSYQYTRKALEILFDRGFPVHINTKSALITRDTDILGSIQRQTMASVAFSFSTPNDALAARMEPNVALTSKRLLALREMAVNGVYCGILYMPVLPFITDTEGQVAEMLVLARDAGAKFILPWFSLSLREGSREYYYKALSALDPALPSRYSKYFGQQYICPSPNSAKLYAMVEEFCTKYVIACHMSEVTTYEKLRIPQQMELFT